MNERIHKAFDEVVLTEERKKKIINDVLDGTVKESYMNNKKIIFWQSKFGGAVVVAAAVLLFVIVNLFALGGNQNLGEAGTPASNNNQNENMSTIEEITIKEIITEIITEEITTEAITTDSESVIDIDKFKEEQTNISEDFDVIDAESDDLKSSESVLEEIKDLPVREGRITNTYGERWGTFHDGICMTSDIDRNIYLSLSGTVTSVEYREEDGNTITVDHGNGVVTEYCHLEEMQVQESDVLETGDIIGIMGQSGYATGVCLHWRIIVDGETVNPMLYVSE